MGFFKHVQCLKIVILILVYHFGDEHKQRGFELTMMCVCQVGEWSVVLASFMSI